MISLPLLVDILVACCACEEPIHYNYSHCEFDYQHLNNAGAQAVVADGVVLKEAYGIRLLVNRSQMNCQIQSPISIFSTAAMASQCSCRDFKYSYNDNLQRIRITSVNEFDENHPAGSEVTDLFGIFLNNDYYGLYETNELVSRYGGSEDQFSLDMMLMLAPEIAGEHAFEIKVELTDGRVFQLKTASIILE